MKNQFVATLSAIVIVSCMISCDRVETGAMVDPATLEVAKDVTVVTNVAPTETAAIVDALIPEPGADKPATVITQVETTIKEGDKTVPVGDGPATPVTK